MRSNQSHHPSTKAHPAKAGAAKPRVLASSATPPTDATKDPTTAELPKGRSAFVFLWRRLAQAARRQPIHRLDSSPARVAAACAVSLAARFSLSPLKPEMFMVPSHMSPPDAKGSMLGKTRLLALCTSAALALSAGCSPDSPTVAGPDAQSDQKGLGAGGHPEIPRLTRGATQISGIGFFAEPGVCTDPEGQGADYVLTMTGTSKVVTTSSSKPPDAHRAEHTMRREPRPSSVYITESLARSRRTTYSRPSIWIAPT